jgi:tricorn protease-like protein
LLLAACGDSTPASLSVSAPTFTPATKSTALATTTPLPAPVPTATPQPKYPVSTQGSIVYEYQGDIWLISLPDGTRRQLTKDGVAKVNNSTINLNENPVWSPDNKQIAFASARDIFNQPNYNHGTEIYTMNPDGSNLKRITQGSASLDIERIPHAWLSTGEILIRQFN